MPIDASGKPLRPAILYGIDTRASHEIEYLEQLLGKEKIYRRSASNLSSQASGPKILCIPPSASAWAGSIQRKRSTTSSGGW